MRLTDATIRSLAAPVRGQVTHTDDTLAGFGIRVSQGGAKSFVLVHGPRRDRVTLGRYPIISLSQARDKARVLLAEQTLGTASASKIKFDEAKQAFLTECRRKNRPRTVKDYERLLTSHFAFGRIPIADINRLEISRKLDKLDDTPAEQNYAFRVIRRFFNFLIQKGHLAVSPCAGMRSPASTSPRTRVLTDAELKAIWDVCSRAEQRTDVISTPPLPTYFPQIVKLLILTGQRRGEVAALQTIYCDLATPRQPNGSDTVILPAALSKNKRNHQFPIGGMAKELLLKAVGEAEGSFLFPARGKPNKPFNGWSKGKRVLDELSGVKAWTLHDLRRTFRTNLSKLGVAPHIAERLVNHISARSEMELVYDQHTYLPEMRDAIERWERELANFPVPLKLHLLRSEDQTSSAPAT